MEKKLKIFRAGRHTAHNGQVLEFGEADLLATIQAYDPDLHEAPLVVGHPGLDAPAYGWVRALSFADGAMNAEPDQVDPAFAELVNAGRFKKISASFYLPHAPGNPAPGVYYLRHVGFLGAQPPAVKGLKSASFAASQEGVVEFGQWDDRVNAGLWRGLRDFLIAKFGLEEADRAVPGYEVETLAEEAARAEGVAGETAAPLFAENNTQEDDMVTPEILAAKEAALQEKEAAFAERESRLLHQERSNRHQEHLAFAEELVREGRLLPAQKEQAVAMLDFAAGEAAGQVVEFGEGDGKKSMPAAELLREFLAAQPRIVEFGETAKGKTPGDESPAARAVRISAYRAQAKASGRNISFAEASAEMDKS